MRFKEFLTGNTQAVKTANKTLYLLTILFSGDFPRAEKYYLLKSCSYFGIFHRLDKKN